MKYLIFFPLFLVAVSATAQTAAPEMDESYNKMLGNLQTAFFTQHFDEYKAMYNRQFKKDDTATPEARERYVYYTYCMAEIKGDEGDNNGAGQILAGLTRFSEFENWDDILGNVAFDSLRKIPAGKMLQQMAWIHLLNVAKDERDPQLSVQLKILFATDRSNKFYNLDDSIKYNRVLKSLVDSISSILDEKGYPGPAMVGDQAAVVAHIISEASLSTQKKYKSLFYTEGIKGNIPNGLAGEVLDKIMVQEKDKQMYGTQYHMVKDKIVFYPVDDAAHVEARRKKIGFKISLKDYQRRIMQVQ